MTCPRFVNARTSPSSWIEMVSEKPAIPPTRFTVSGKLAFFVTVVDGACGSWGSSEAQADSVAVATRPRMDSAARDTKRDARHTVHPAVPAGHVQTCRDAAGNAMSATSWLTVSATATTRGSRTATAPTSLPSVGTLVPSPTAARLGPWP